jgi:hypothetical protein
MIQVESVKEKIREAVREFKALDHAALLKVNVYEATISHRIAVYLGNLFRELNVDCEYSRRLAGAKKAAIGDNLRHDIIIHKRLIPNNCIIFEVKKSGKDSQKSAAGIKKLEDAINNNLGYDLGVFIGILKRRVDICWIEKINGNLSKTCETF